MAVVRARYFDPGPGAEVFAITDDAEHPTLLDTFSSAIVFRAAALNIQGQRFNCRWENR
jgi:hypothetical protein